MLHIIIIILKIIGFLVLAILGLFLLALLAVTTVPIRYRLEGNYLETPKGSTKITWLLHILSLKAVYDGEFIWTVRIFGYRLFKPKKNRREKTDEAFEQLTVQELSIPDDKAKETAEELSTPIPKIPMSRENGPSEKKTKPAHDGKKKMRIGQRLKRLVNQWKLSLSHICGKLKDIKESKDMAMEWIHDEANQKTIKLVMRQVKRLLRHILPTKFCGKITFGFDDPYLTGIALSFLSLILPFYHKQLRIEPVFDQMILKGEFCLKGRIRLGTLLLCAARIYMNKNFRIIFKKLLR